MRTKASGILRFWHQVEFFIPFDLQQQVLEAEDAEWAVRAWPRGELQSPRTPLWKPTIPEGHQLTGFDLFLGVFDKSLLGKETQRAVCKALSPEEDWDQDERCELEGPTCVAKIRLGPRGEPLLGEVSVSTVPWALGYIRDGRWEALDFDAFLESQERLKARLQQFRAERCSEAEADEVSEGEGLRAAAPATPLTASELLALLELFYEWAGLRLEPPEQNDPVLIVRARTSKERSRKRSAAATCEPPSSAEGTPGPDDGEDEEEDADGEDEIEIDILNSFFAKDIERAIRSLERQEPCPVLQSYLSPIPREERLDLYRPEGREHLMEMLSPARLSHGHWLSEPSHVPSLMQQFAINSLLERLAGGGLFSVNGPPGTGKTTLLREVFAELITRRARALAELDASRDAFRGQQVEVFFKGEQRSCHVRFLREELIGFEMVVASSNNAAVENLSRDLPKAQALGKTWRDEQGHPRVGYLQPVAHNIAARKANGQYEKLKPDDTPWGLIAGVLGNKSNRRRFGDRLFFDGKTNSGGEKNGSPPKGFDPKLHQSIWSWRDEYRRRKGPSFDEAKAAFLDADASVKRRIAQLQRYADLVARTSGQTLERYTAEPRARSEQARQALEAARTNLQALDDDESLCASQLATLREEERLLDQDRPAWWARLFRRAQENQYQTDRADNHQQQRQWLARQRKAAARRPEAQRQFQLATDAQEQAAQKLTERIKAWHAIQDEKGALARAFPSASCPSSSEALEEPRWQIDGLWRDDTLNRLRSELFAAALGLHEAWLAEVLKRGGGFGENLIAVSHLLSGKRLQESQHALAIWQSLFMVVPVISSTFASIASQFRELEKQTLGWLFIDEAGQAVPQAAVGALWRAKRAVAVGDPLQIEPVFTVPIKLIDALAYASRLPDAREVAPHRASVQNLADSANPVGTWRSEEKWIGSPLRVHRRCVDPMFTLANGIAYQGKMIFFDPERPASRQPPKESLDIGPSAWVDIGGTTRSKQVVPEQIDLAFRAVVALYRVTGTLPALYLISPFRRIKNELFRKLSDPDHWPTARPPPATTLREWCRARIGTVHTFQGKEESIVWMVLGCDDKTRGAANWAASKPNLLNVALTRAKHRFFIFGEERLWADQPYFSEAHAELLPRIHPDVFLQRVEKAQLSVSPASPGLRSVASKNGDPSQDGSAAQALDPRS